VLRLFPSIGRPGAEIFWVAVRAVPDLSRSPCAMQTGGMVRPSAVIMASKEAKPASRTSGRLAA
jgi:hypothetical protein